MTFDEFWLTGPWLKVRKKQAERSWNASIKSAEDVKNIECARNNYASDLKANPWKHPMHGSTFMNNWKDFIGKYWKERPPVMDDDGTPLFSNNEHLCVICSPPHAWPCADEACGCTYELACPDTMKKLVRK